MIADIGPSHKRILKRLRDDVKRSRKRMAPYRAKVRQIIQQYLGVHYSQEAAADRVPINMIELAHTIYLNNLVGGTPQVNVTTFHDQLKPGAANLKLAVNHVAKEIKLGKTLRQVAADALFGYGMVKTGICDYDDHMNALNSPGQWFCDRVSPDDSVWDMEARDLRQVTYIGNRYRMRLFDIRNAEYFDETARMKVRAADRDYSDIDETATERIADLAGSRSKNMTDRFVEYAELWDIYLPREQVLITFADQEGLDPLRIAEWGGPEGGPFHMLQFTQVPDNVLPLAPAMLWMDMHLLFNQMFNQLARQALRQKDVIAFQGDATQDALAIQKTSDGEFVRVDNPQQIKEFKFGGIDESSWSFLLGGRNLFSYMAGNLDALGGLAPSSETVRQDAMLNENASQRVREMQNAMSEFTGEVMRDGAFYLWTDPFIDLPLVKREPGLDFDIPVRYTPEMREGDFLDYNFSIEPHKLVQRTPGEKAQSVTQVLNMFTPYLEIMGQQGLTPNFPRIIQLLGDYMNMPEIVEILKPGMYPTPGPIGQAPTKGSNTTRTYERVSRPGSTRQGAEDVMMRTLMGGKSQGSEQAAAVREIA